MANEETQTYRQRRENVREPKKEKGNECVLLSPMHSPTITRSLAFLSLSGPSHHSTISRPEAPIVHASVGQSRPLSSSGMLSRRLEWARVSAIERVHVSVREKDRALKKERVSDSLVG